MISSLILLAAAQCSNIDGSVIFHDQSPSYCAPLEPQLNSSVTLRLRAAAGDLSAASVRIWDTGMNNGAGGEFYVPMYIERQSGPYAQFDTWRADFNVGDDRLWYRFKLEDNGCVNWYQTSGVLDNVDLSIPDFQIHPGFSGPAWARGAVGYQIFPDRFNNGTTTNDPVSGQWDYPWPGWPIIFHNNWLDLPQNSSDFFGGDLYGIYQRTDYLNWLGIEFIYLNPVFESRSNHRYDATTYDSIDPMLGSNSDFNTFVRVLKRQGIRVVLDGVLNHCSSWSDWFDRYETSTTVGAHESPSTSPYGDWFTFGSNFDHYSQPDDYCSWYGYDTLPKLNYANASVRDEMIRSSASVLRKWLATGISGWRLDAAEDVGPGCSGGDHSVWREMRDILKTDDPESLLILEEWGNAQPWLEGDQFDGVMNFDGFLFPLQEYSLYSHTATEDFKNAMLRAVRAYPATANHSSWNQLGNHDISRALTRASNDLLRLREAIFLQMCLPGSPVLYYGDEIGMQGGSDPDNRRTLNWDISTWNIPTLLHTRKLIKLRKQNPALREGSFDPYWVHHSGRVIVFAREHPQQTLLAVSSNSSQGLQTDIPVNNYFADGDVLIDLLSGNSVTVINSHISMAGSNQLGSHDYRLYKKS
ncbi:MAG: glycoside hydrolase family 13 protein [Planctomycetes bacterium]|nr:glycoside hydrolase family 13 protein [Planctomycetota bacterium]